jgi:alkylated DNA nucleotide flippase Atl1
MNSQAQVVSELARTVARALDKFADDYEAAAGATEVAVTEEVVVPVARGERQRQILDLEGLATEGGMKTADIAGAIGYEVPNTHSTMQALERNGLVELVPHATPQTWRLAPRYRNNAPVFKRVASRVKAGEWTTYGDISIAVRGDTKAARGVGRAAATMPDFPHPERILMEGGEINENWKDAQGRGPDYCRELLISQGVKFDEAGRADKASKVDWAELRRRDQSEPVAE